MAFGRWKKEKKDKIEKTKDELKRERFPIRAYVATPAYDGKVHTDFAISLAESAMTGIDHGILTVAAVMGNGAFIDLARNNFVYKFLETDCTHLFFIDSDLKWEHRAYVGLLTAKMPICAGVYRRRQEPEDYPCRAVVDKDGLLQIERGGWVQCDRVPTGFLCIERWVIEEMAAEAQKIKQHGQPDVARLFYTKINETGAFMGEDFCFCDDYVAKYQKNIWVWPDFDFVHDKWPCNWHKFLNTQVEQIEAQEKEAANG